MTTGEKIKKFRNLKGLTQKALAQMSKLSEISIRKYESGERTPKEKQLSQIASALGINIKLLHEFSELENYGDAMVLFFILEKDIGIDYKYETDTNGKIKADTISFNFNNNKFNKLISSWIEKKEKFNDLKSTSNLIYPDLSENEIAEKFHDISEVQKQILTLNKEPLTKKGNY